MATIHETIPDMEFYKEHAETHAVKRCFEIAIKGWYSDLALQSIDDQEGIYFVFVATIGDDGATLHKLIYIGQGKRIRNRLKNHEKRSEFISKCNKEKGESLVYYAGRTGPISDVSLDWCEAAVITEFENRDIGSELINDQHSDNYGYETAKIKLQRAKDSNVEGKLPNAMQPYEFIVYQDVLKAKPSA